MSQVTQDDIKQRANTIILRAAQKFRIPAYTITAAQFWACANHEVTDWQMRKIGSFTKARNELFPIPLGAENIGQSNAYKRFKAYNSKLSNFKCHYSDPVDMFAQAGLSHDKIFKLLIMPDAHVEEHDPYALNAFNKFAQDYKPHGLINLGDFMEMDAVTHWPIPDARPRRLVPQIQTAKKLLKEIEDACGKQCKFKKFLIGNHEDWLDQYLTGKIPEALYDLESLGVDLRFQELLGLTKFGYDTIPLNEILKIGNHAHFIHGYYTNEQHASKHLKVFGVNIYYGHLHDLQQFSTVSVNGVHEAMSLGCLRKLDAPFLKGKPNNWSHAVGIFEFAIDGTYTRYIPAMINAQFSWNGKLYDGKTL